MTFGTFHIEMFVQQLVSRLFVVIEADGLPLLFVVTLKTISIKLPLVDIGMAGHTLFFGQLRKQILRLKMLSHGATKKGEFFGGWGMTVSALEFTMRAL